MHTSEIEQDESVRSYHYNLLSPWQGTRSLTEVLNARSSYSTVPQRQVKAEKERVLAGQLHCKRNSSENKSAAMCIRMVRDSSSLQLTVSVAQVHGGAKLDGLSPILPSCAQCYGVRTRKRITRSPQ